MPPTLTWLPEPGPRVAAPPPPPLAPNPYARAILQNGFNPPTKSSRKRLRPTGPTFIFILLVIVGAGILGSRYITSDKESSNDIAAPATLPAATVPIVTTPPVP